MPELPRQVIRERSFERELRALIQDAREADDFVEGAEFVLARDPEIARPWAREFGFSRWLRLAKRSPRSTTRSTIRRSRCWLSRASEAARLPSMKKRNLEARKP